MLRSLKDEIKEFLLANQDVLYSRGAGALDPLFKEFGDQTNKKYLSKVKAELLNELDGEKPEIKKVTTEKPTKKTTEKPTKKATEKPALSNNDIALLKNFILEQRKLQGNLSQFDIIHMIRSRDDIQPRSIRISKKLLQQAKDKAKAMNITLQDLINLAIYKEVSE